MENGKWKKNGGLENSECSQSEQGSTNKSFGCVQKKTVHTMGNTLSEGASPMAISAMSNYTVSYETVFLFLLVFYLCTFILFFSPFQHFEKHELSRLRDQVKRFFIFILKNLQYQLQSRYIFDYFFLFFE
jgi:hypothetical protein